jgi:cysteine desulfurase
MPKLPIYLDNNATTPVDPRVVEAMLPYFTEMFGNAASISHAFGRTAWQAVEASRASIAKSLNAASPLEIVFTSGATESDNLAIKGVAETYRDRGNHIITAKTEHKAILDSCKHLQQNGYEITYLDVDSDGLVSLSDIANAINERTILVSLMAGNNEIGVLQDIAGIGALCKERDVLFHTDATQAIGKIPFDVRALNVDLASFSAHKIYGPKGVGGLYVCRNSKMKLTAQMDGGGHENGNRSGTLNVTGIIGLAKALHYCVEELDSEASLLKLLRERLLTGLQSKLENIKINGHPTQRLPGHLSLVFGGVQGEQLLGNIPEVALSSISACSTGSSSPSHVLSALGLTDEQALSTIRFGIGRFNTAEEIDYTIGRVVEVVNKLRERATAPNPFAGVSRD